MTNSLPLPRVRRCARVTRAAVQLDEAAHDGQTEAEPALRAVEGLRSWTNRSKIRGSISGAMPMPRVAHAEHDLVAVALGGRRDAAAASVYFAALVSRFATTCARRAASPSTTEPASAPPTRELVRALLEQRARHLDRLRHDVGQLDPLLA